MEPFFLEVLDMLLRPGRRARLRAAGRLCCCRLSVHLRTRWKHLVLQPLESEHEGHRGSQRRSLMCFLPA